MAVIDKYTMNPNDDYIVFNMFSKPLIQFIKMNDK